MFKPHDTEWTALPIFRRRSMKEDLALPERTFTWRFTNYGLEMDRTLEWKPVGTSGYIVGLALYADRTFWRYMPLNEGRQVYAEDTFKIPSVRIGVQH
jgi:hypothetical protein